MRYVQEWPKGTAVMNASQIILAIEPRQKPEAAETAITKDKVILATQATISKHESNFTKVVKIKPHIEVES